MDHLRRRRPSRVRALATLLAGAAGIAGCGLFADPADVRRDGVVDQPGAEWVAASPANYRYAARPDSHRIDRIVVHVTQSRFKSAVRSFQSPNHRAASHYLVRARDGHVAQIVREADIAYHAGNRDWNARSIGIEHEGYVDDPDRWFTDAAYVASARLAADIAERYDIPIDREHIVGHSEVPGATHTDPGRGWDWKRYMRLVRAAARHNDGTG